MNLLDLHCDTISECWKNQWDLLTDKTGVSLNSLPAFGRWLQTFALFIPDEFRGQEAIRYFDSLMDYSDRLLLQHRNGLFPILSKEDLAALPAGKCGYLKAVEGGAALAGQLMQVQRVFDRGVRMITLTWNGQNELGSGVLAQPDEGLTPFGREAVAEMERLGIVADASHLSPRSFWDLCETAERPFICSHSNSKTVCGHPRNLEDSQFREIVRRGGLVGINLYVNFLSEDPSGGGVQDVLKHIDHFLSLGGEHTLAIGTDLDGAAVHSSLNSSEKLAVLREAMVKLGLKEQTVENIFYGNAYRFLEKALPSERSGE